MDDNNLMLEDLDLDMEDLDLDLDNASTTNTSVEVSVEEDITGEIDLEDEDFEVDTQADLVDAEVVIKDELDVDHFFEDLGIEETKKAKKKVASTEKKAEQPKEPEYLGPKVVVVYGQELFIEEDPKITLDAIRERIVNEFMFPEFSKDRTEMSLDKSTGIVVPIIQFKKKG